MESNTNNISSSGLHGLDQSQRRAETSEEVDIRQGQNALGSLSLSTGLTPSHNRARNNNNNNNWPNHDNVTSGNAIRSQQMATVMNTEQCHASENPQVTFAANVDCHLYR